MNSELQMFRMYQVYEKDIKIDFPWWGYLRKFQLQLDNLDKLIFMKNKIGLTILSWVAF
jgi:hypothetical protein